MCQEHYKHFEWKRLRVTNNTKVLNERKYNNNNRFQMKENARGEHYEHEYELIYTGSY